MLAQFTLKSTFNAVRMTLFVDLERKEAIQTVTVGGRLVHNQVVREFWEVDSLEKAEKWFTTSRSPLYATRIEQVHAVYFGRAA